jgi:4-hydroxy-3-methylbut-2-enyl diphosphate reductase
MTTDFIPQKETLKIMVTSGASCPDALVERVIARLAELTANPYDVETLVANL